LSLAVSYAALLAFLPFATPTETVWTGQSAGFRVTISRTDIAVVRGQGASEQTVFSLEARRRAELSDLEKEAQEWAADMAQAESLPAVTEASSGSTYAPLSMVGPYLSLEVASGGYWPGAAHPSAITIFEVVDLGDTGRRASLERIFPEADLLSALLADKIVQTQLGDSGPRPKTLAALVKALAESDNPCEYSFATDLLSHFAFYDVVGGKVAVRIGLPYGCEVARGNLTQLGILLDIPAGLKADLARARAGGGFVMKDAARRFKGLDLGFAWTKDLAPQIEAERKRKQRR
jgi:hypothetical protein